MTPDQLKAIAAMQITRDSAMTLMQAQGITLGGGQPGSGAAEPPPGAPGDMPPGGQPPSDAQPPSGDGQPGPGQPPSGGRSGTGQIAGGMISPEMFDAVIQVLGGAPSTASAPSAPPSGSPPSGAPGSASSSFSFENVTAAYTQAGGTETKTGTTYTAADTDQSAIYVTAGGVLTLEKATITTSGNTSSADNSSFHGLNAAVLAAGGSTLQPAS